MGRSTFEGPVLQGDNRFGALRNVGYSVLAQGIDLTLTNTTANTAGFAGSSGVYADSNIIPNGVGVVYTSSSTTYPPTVATITADPITATGTIYRGGVLYLPYASTILDFVVDTQAAITMTGGTIGTVALYISNGFNTGTTPAYGSISSINSAGRQTVAFTAAQLANLQATSGDITNPPNGASGGQGTGPNSALVSQVVFNIAIPYTAGSGSAAPVLTAGTVYFTCRYTQADGNIGTTTTYPYGNLD